mmetsp:Transcript_8451/g.31437  ORF Transcript_8451/g.31437 Transcript_8451/m.31437 type:complete len:118 (-) Transcript_8451:1185-1538(-)|eukprot:CAMPEP_0174577910 /NCGR_PEP_ID=MMETSP0929-20130131/331_1 /TAXON_ID=548131 ORGANISM="Ostreococcus mediterraneus, Strain clade-D-RCC2572" /NCGR_SAMPLE_ID=MMETSP0929 /ASSEMBLY_ACC=CAM_ASM_000573 /LENGTH=117 /DNA_ID=CAMNT_0015758827 /DNA_START=84 /DNA_END=437 /DNA_ORIENTATION=-
MAICASQLRSTSLARIETRSTRKHGTTTIVKSVSCKSSAVRATAVKSKSTFESAKLSASAVASTAIVSALSSPLAAEAAITPSLKNTLLSVLAGGVVLGAIAAAVIGVSSFDKVTRK